MTPLPQLVARARHSRALRPIEVALETLRSAGLSEEETVHSYRAVVGFVGGA